MDDDKAIGFSDSVRRRAGLWLALVWVVATTASASAGWILTNILVARSSIMQYPEIALSDDNALGPLLLFGLGLLFLLAPIVGIAQGLAFKYALMFRYWPLWAVATFIGLLIALAVGIVLNMAAPDPVAAGCIWSIIPGLMLGVAQRFVLENDMKIKRSETWIVSCVVGWLVGEGVTLLAHNFFYASKEGDFNLPYYPPQAAVAWALAWTLGCLAFSLITGASLVWIIEESAKHPTV